MLMLCPGDKEIVKGYLSGFEEEERAALVEAYNTAYQSGFFGVRRQALNYLALHCAFEKRFGISPFTVSKGVLLEFSTPIQLAGEEWISIAV